MEKKFKIWSQGFCVTGMGGVNAPHHLVGEATGKDFLDACKKFYKNNPNFEIRNGVPYDWGCRLFPTAKEARKTFG